MDTFESIVEIKHGATVLVALGEPMWAPVAINGQQLVDVVARVRAAGVKAFPRGNESNTLTFEKCDEAASIASAFKNELLWAAGLPRIMADVTITFEDGASIILADAAVESWSGGQEDRLGRQGLRIIGGTLTVAPPPNMIVSGTLTPNVAGTYVYAGEAAGRPAWGFNGATVVTGITTAGQALLIYDVGLAQWIINTQSGHWGATGTPALPNLATAWVPFAGVFSTVTGTPVVTAA